VFAASESFLLFDYFRVPYERSGSSADVNGLANGSVGWIRPTGGGTAALLWARSDVPVQGSIVGAFKLDDVLIFGSISPDEAAKSVLAGIGGKWHRLAPIYDAAGSWVASIWGESGGDVFLPFDPNDVIRRYWSETYLDLAHSHWGRATHSLARKAYYRTRPFVPRGGQMLARRWFSRHQSRQQFPRWPIETALHDLYGALLSILSKLAGEAVPMISLWPNGYSWAFLLTHDVETPAGYDTIELLCDIERSAGYRSSWNFVPRNHHVVHDHVVEELWAEGFEVGVHGLHHDGRDIEEFDARLPEIREFAERWRAPGFRSPSTLRRWEVMARLPFEYDATYFDTSPFEPQSGGCCSWLPYMIGDLVELPTTLPQDHTLFEILGLDDAEVWLAKARFLKERNGMALALTHPDYSSNERLVNAYRALLAEFVDDATAWKALPYEVSRWWRQRAASTLSRQNGEWVVVGPDSERARVQVVVTGDDWLADRELSSPQPSRNGRPRASDVVER
jgi:peptidoglycan/xylan/chitin deacetylase (PgdA/CDA1 family)